MDDNREEHLQKMQIIDYERLKTFTQTIFLKIGCTEAHSRKGADVLVSADLRGVDTHGVARLSSYVRLWEIGRISPRPNIQIVHETPSTAVMDGDSGLGMIIAPEAMALAIQKAEQVGTGWVAVKNSNHYGIAGYHAMLALGHDMIGISMTNASPLVAPTFSRESMLGTNPIAVAFPAGEEDPFVADFATTTASYGKVENHQRKFAPVPYGWVQDSKGNPSQDCHAVSKGGAMLPLGSDKKHGSHKGYCLGGMVDIFSAVLSGANYGPWVPPYVPFLEKKEDLVGDGIGHFFGALRVDAFRPAEEFKLHMDKWIRRFRDAEPTKDTAKVLIPGDMEREYERRYTSEGIPLLSTVVDDLKRLADKFNITF